MVPLTEFRTLGSLGLRRSDGTELTPMLSRRKRLALLAYLALAAPRGFHRRDTLLGLFWPELDAEHARAALRQALAVLRRTLGEDVLPTRGSEEVGLDWERFWCDAVEFDRAVKAGRPEQALELFRGDLLNGFFISGAPAFERWLEDERRRAREQAARVAIGEAERQGTQGRAGDAGALIRRAVELAPGDEELLRRAASLLDVLGDRATAVALYERFAEGLRKEFELEPAPETTALITMVRARQAAENGVAGYVPPRAPAVPVDNRPSSRGARLLARPVAAVAVVLLGVSISDLSPALVGPERAGLGRTASWLAPSAEWRARPRIAVLSMRNLDGDSTGARFASGITEDIAARLSAISGLTVLARDLVQRLEATRKPPQALADALQLSALVEGSARRSGNRVRIVAQLVNARSDTYLWAGTFDRDLADVFAVQAEIADSIARVLSVTLTEEDRRLVRRVATQQWSANEYSEEARRVWNSASGTISREGQPVLVEARRKRREYAMSLVQRALDIDSRFGIAMVQRALYRYDYARTFGGSPVSAESTEAAIRIGISMDSMDARSWRGLGLFYQFQRRPRSAAEANLRVLQLDPNYVYAMIGLDWAWTSTGRFADAARMKVRTYSLWPEARGDALARISLLLGDYATAEAWYTHVLKSYPDMAVVAAELAEVHFLNGKVADAISGMQEAVGRSGGSNDALVRNLAALLQLILGKYEAAVTLLEPIANRPDFLSYVEVRSATNLAFAYQKLGRFREADSLFEISRQMDRQDLERSMEEFGPQLDLARIAAVKSDRAEAYRWLEAAIDAGWRLCYRIGQGENDPLFENLRSDRRFRGLMAKVKADVDSQRKQLEASQDRVRPPLP